jgi:hypothetical protein
MLSPGIGEGKAIDTYPIADTGSAILAGLECVYQRNNDTGTRVADSMTERNCTAAQTNM